MEPVGGAGLLHCLAQRAADAAACGLEGTWRS